MSGDSRITAPWSSIEIEIKMAKVIEALDDAVLVHKALVEAAANKRHAYKLKEAQLQIQARGLMVEGDTGKWTVDEKKAWVYTNLGELELEYQIADGQATAQREVIRSLQSEAELLRSLARSSRDLVEGPGYGGGGRDR